MADRKIGRDAETGHFTTVKKARYYPKTHTVEKLPPQKRGK